MYYLTPIYSVRGFAAFVKCNAYYLAMLWFYSLQEDRSYNVYKA